MKTKAQKQDEAAHRQHIAEMRSVEEQLARLDKRPGEAAKERAKLAGRKEPK